MTKQKRARFSSIQLKSGEEILEPAKCLKPTKRYLMKEKPWSSNPAITSLLMPDIRQNRLPSSKDYLSTRWLRPSVGRWGSKTRVIHFRITIICSDSWQALPHLWDGVPWEILPSESLSGIARGGMSIKHFGSNHPISRIPRCWRLSLRLLSIWFRQGYYGLKRTWLTWLNRSMAIANLRQRCIRGGLCYCRVVFWDLASGCRLEENLSRDFMLK